MSNSLKLHNLVVSGSFEFLLTSIFFPFFSFLFFFFSWQGFSHDTKKISEYEINFVDRHGAFNSLVFADTQGTDDTEEYTQYDLFQDMGTHATVLSENKIVMVIPHGRLFAESMSMIRFFNRVFSGKFLIMVTNCPHREQNEVSHTLLNTLRERGVIYTGSPICADWMSAEEKEQARAAMLEALCQLEHVDIRKLPRGSFISRISRRLDTVGQQLLKRQGFADVLAATCLLAVEVSSFGIHPQVIQTQVTLTLTAGYSLVAVARLWLSGKMR